MGLERPTGAEAAKKDEERELTEEEKIAEANAMLAEFTSLVKEDGTLSDEFWTEQAKWYDRKGASEELLEALDRGGRAFKEYADAHLTRLAKERKKALQAAAGVDSASLLAVGTDPMIRLAATELAEVDKRSEQVQEATDRRVDKLEAEIDAARG
jgi:hypothetical protein